MGFRWPPASFWEWLPAASVSALTAAKEAIEHEIANREAQEKEAFLRFWKDHPVPCNRCCRHYHGDQKCPFPCAHTSTDPDQWMSHTVQMTGTDAQRIGFCNLSHKPSRTVRQGENKLQRQPDVALVSKIKAPRAAQCMCVLFLTMSARDHTNTLSMLDCWL